MRIPNKFNGYSADNRRLYNMGGGGGPNTTYSNTSNIPEYARPYVEQMLGATQRQLFTGSNDAQGNFKPTGFNNFTPYGYTAQKDEQGNDLRDENGNMMFTNTARQQAQAAVAPVSAGQQMATNTINQYVNPNQTTAASRMTADLAGRSAASGYYSPMQAERFQLGAPQQVRSDSFTQPGVSQGYMSPYMQNVVNAQQREARRSGEIQRNQNQAQAVNAGAFGGSRQAIMEAERQRNLSNQLGDIQAQGLQQAYTQGQGQFNAEQNAYLQAQQANQQANMQTGIQNLQAQQDAQRQQEASRQFGAQLGLQGYNQAGQLAGQLGQLGQQQYGQDMGTIQAMAGLGAQEQAQEQNIINQDIQNYGTAQQYPLMQLGVMSNMLRGLPMQASTTNMYQQQPSMASQIAGGVGTGLGLYQQGQQAGFIPRKEGGIIKMAAGGIATGVASPKLEAMVKRPNFDDKKLAAKSQDPATDQATKDIMAAEMARRAGLRAGAPVMAANGGIIAFKDGEEVKDIDETKKGILRKLKEEGPVSSATGSSPEKSDVDPYASNVGPYLANKAGILPPTAKPTYEETLEQQIANLTKSQGLLDKDRNLSVTDRMKQQEAEREKMGLPSPYGKELEKLTKRREKVDEDSVQDARENLTMFLQRWGTTPGATLLAMNKAGMEMVEKSGLDRKARRKLLDQLDGVERDLRTGEYQRRLGEEERARNHIEKAGKEYNQVGEKIVEYTVKLINNEATNEARTKIAELAEKLREAKATDKPTDYQFEIKNIVAALKTNPKFKDVPDAILTQAAMKQVVDQKVRVASASVAQTLPIRQQDSDTRASAESVKSAKEIAALVDEAVEGDPRKRDAKKADRASKTSTEMDKLRAEKEAAIRAKISGAPAAAPASGGKRDAAGLAAFDK
jgi:hypothetical protein